MPELRWTLLILGALFIGALAWWELRRQRQAPRGLNQSGSQGTGAGAHQGSHGSSESGGDGVRVYREPTISFPELQPAESRGEARAPVRGREAQQDPRVVELDDTSWRDLHAAEDRAVEGEAGQKIDSAEAEDRGIEEIAATSPERVEAFVGEAPLSASEADEETVAFGAADSEAESARASEQLDSEGLSVTAEERVAYAPEPAQPPAGATAGEPIVDWPGEQSRKILALRLVSAPAARFPGRSVRMALAAEGFVLGKFDIFHKPGPDSRAMLSAASLTKPGTFALNTIDAQRFGGISLFAVLPGPLPAQQTYDELLATARSLNNRLQGALQDERGEPLTPVRSTNIRDSLTSGGGAETLQ
jgi:FtsZ-interacting cell division protein ZipA